MVGDRRTRDLKEPALNARCASRAIDIADSFDKDLLGQILSLFPVTHFAVDEPVDDVQVVFIESLQTF